MAAVMELPQQQEVAVASSGDALGGCGLDPQQLQQVVGPISSPFRGLCYDKKHNTWRVRIFYLGKQRHVGRFKDDVTAARAYDKSAFYLYGHKAILNFSAQEAMADESEVPPAIQQAKLEGGSRGGGGSTTTRLLPFPWRTTNTTYQPCHPSSSAYYYSAGGHQPLQQHLQQPLQLQGGQFTSQPMVVLSSGECWAPQQQQPVTLSSVALQGSGSSFTAGQADLSASPTASSNASTCSVMAGIGDLSLQAPPAAAAATAAGVLPGGGGLVGGSGCYVMQQQQQHPANVVLVSGSSVQHVVHAPAAEPQYVLVDMSGQQQQQQPTFVVMPQQQQQQQLQLAPGLAAGSATWQPVVLQGPATAAAATSFCPAAGVQIVSAPPLPLGGQQQVVQPSGSIGWLA